MKNKIEDVEIQLQDIQDKLRVLNNFMEKQLILNTELVNMSEALKPNIIRFNNTIDFHSEQISTLVNGLNTAFDLIERGI